LSTSACCRREIGVVGVSGAIANAVYHATGRRIRSLPVGPPRKDCLMAITEVRKRPETPLSYSDATTRRITADNAIEYAYRELGESEVPLVLLQHFRGNLDNWDPALVDALAAERRVITFDNVGVAATTGTTPSTIEAMAHGATAFVEALGLQRVDLLGFSIGSFVAQEIALIRPDLLRRIVLASAAPQGAAGMHGWAPQVIGAVGGPETNPDGYLSVFFAPTATSLEAGQQAAGRIFGGRTVDCDAPTTWQTRQAQYDAVCAWGIPNHALLERVTAIDLPVLVANGDSDPMILPRYSYLLAGLLPDARLKIYPDSAHGFLFQHHSEFAADVQAFLEEAD
jgi:pimeloyl-ACP methyl ester carboxylesterase